VKWLIESHYVKLREHHGSGRKPDGDNDPKERGLADSANRLSREA
jgi:hypothetical protein